MADNDAPVGADIEEGAAALPDGTARQRRLKPTAPSAGSRR